MNLIIFQTSLYFRIIYVMATRTHYIYSLLARCGVKLFAVCPPTQVIMSNGFSFHKCPLPFQRSTLRNIIYRNVIICRDCFRIAINYRNFWTPFSFKPLTMFTVSQSNSTLLPIRYRASTRVRGTLLFRSRFHHYVHHFGHHRSNIGSLFLQATRQTSVSICFTTGLIPNRCLKLLIF